MTQTQPPAPPAVRGGGLAVAALILGLCALIPLVGILCSLPAAALGILSLVRRAPRTRLAVAGILLALVVAVPLQTVVVVGGLVAGLRRARNVAKRSVCAAKLRNIGMIAITLWQEDDGAMPPDLKRLITDGALEESALVCPSAATGRDCDYFYLPAAADASARAFLACDLKGNHGDDGRNVLYVDLSVRFVPEADFQAELALPCNAAFAAALKKAEGP